MRCLLAVIFSALLLLVVACGSEPKPDEVAGKAAKLDYDYLVDGKYEMFVDGYYQPDSIPASYREQLVTNAKMFAGQQKDIHGGILRVSVVSVVADTARHVAEAFLSLAYGDSTNEEVVVPMVERDNVWYMK